jgi:hypothetical protein
MNDPYLEAARAIAGRAMAAGLPRHIRQAPGGGRSDPRRRVRSAAARKLADFAATAAAGK